MLMADGYSTYTLLVWFSMIPHDDKLPVSVGYDSSEAKAGNSVDTPRQ